VVTALGINQVNSHGSANTNHTNCLSLRKVMGADGGDETINPQPPGLEVTTRDPSRVPLGYHELRRWGPRPPRRKRKTSVDSRPGNTNHKDPVERSAGADYALGIVLPAPARVNGRVLPPHSLSVKSSPLDAGIADVDQENVHA
jgi:hypothetical protein